MEIRGWLRPAKGQLWVGRTLNRAGHSSKASQSFHALRIASHFRRSPKLGRFEHFQLTRQEWEKGAWPSGTGPESE